MWRLCGSRNWKILKFPKVQNVERNIHRSERDRVFSLKGKNKSQKQHWVGHRHIFRWMSQAKSFVSANCAQRFRNRFKTGPAIWISVQFMRQSVFAPCETTCHGSPTGPTRPEASQWEKGWVKNKNWIDIVKKGNSFFEKREFEKQVIRWKAGEPWAGSQIWLSGWGPWGRRVVLEQKAVEFGPSCFSQGFFFFLIMCFSLVLNLIQSTRFSHQRTICWRSSLHANMAKPQRATAIYILLQVDKIPWPMQVMIHGMTIKSWVARLKRLKRKSRSRSGKRTAAWWALETQTHQCGGLWQCWRLQCAQCAHRRS